MNYLYYFKNYQDEIIYVGRTANLKRRMKQHFTKGHLPKECYDEINTIMYTEVNDSKYDTEICETILINKYKPKYNTEKSWSESYDKTSYDLIALNFNELYIYFLNDEFNIVLKDFKYPCYDMQSNLKDRCLLLIDYNLGNLKHKVGLYNNLNSDIFKANRYLQTTLIDLHNIVKNNIKVEESNLDEPISDNGDLDLSYVAFDIELLNTMKLSSKIISLLIHCGYIFRITDDIYAIPLHTKNILKTINYNYLH